ncbi:MAG: hypothetical protein CXX69_06205 [Candidatus Thalassarchaeum betae]|uniref:Uncharacterized protein n=1 Tax=Candidatus Thalassarchaeum betae TaxID=2599289 RepID=A0A2V3HQ32_9ARCH|nr:MAG: hypothetical protein CXX69_06205 [Candidatus Thalassoarchaea betae]PXF25290.1 MAG: hypothetical protein CXX70_07695 [Euryarchaeota archaeon]HIC50042.1 hypothetical protein [Candidatus Poseidoniales archaeon]HIM13310.1 hypothetical protein [Candidatus Poseidoniales archaeon]HIM93134.1 hypothetical protein [Candidatus Poseidoniales archaeon]
MPKVVHISGAVDAFYHALADRLHRAGATLTDDPEEADVTVGIGEGASGDVAVVPAHVDHGEAGLVVRIHDLLIPEGAVDWGTEVLHEWADWVKDGAEGIHPPDIEARHWVHVRDATDALSLLILADSDAMVQGVLDMSGRRAWSAKSILDEMRMLWSRFTNALHHTHTISSLSDNPSPASSSYRPRPARPDLGPLHDALLRAGGEGWRPLVSMRMGLMEVFAHSAD